MTDYPERLRRRISNALWGLFIGDSLAMPVHWYYNRKNIDRDFDGGVTGYESPRHPHPESFMVGMSYEPDVSRAKSLGRPYDILHDHARFYRTSYSKLNTRRTDREGEHGNAVPELEERYHYHHGLSAGENTLGAQLVRVLLRSVVERETYDPEHFLTRFVEHLTTPGSNRDPYLEIYIRRWFESYTRGTDIYSSAEHQRRSWSIGSMGGAVRPLVLSLLLPDNTSMATGVALEHQNLTHRSENVSAAVASLISFLHALVKGGEKRRLLRELAKRTYPPKISGKELFAAYKAHKGPGNIPKTIMWRYHTELADEPLDLDALLQEEDDRSVAPERFATACYPEHGVPLIIYLLARNRFDPARALLANANMGGDNAHRGMLLGLLLGAASDKMPPGLIQGLMEYRAISAEIDAFVDFIFDDPGNHRI
jgi:ADP-ribosylglycohydrolase